MKLHLLRHGRTLANVNHLYCGSTDIPLSAEGLCELKSLLNSNVYPDVSGIAAYTSGMQRAEQTLYALYGNIPHAQLSDMHEMDFGQFEMRSYEQMKEDADYIRWITDETGMLSCPDGESSAEFKARVFKCFDLLVEKQLDSLVVCHGGVITELMLRLFPDENRNFYEWQPSAGHGYTIIFDKKKAIAYFPIPTPK